MFSSFREGVPHGERNGSFSQRLPWSYILDKKNIFHWWRLIVLSKMQVHWNR
jgi:hypothetical protein